MSIRVKAEGLPDPGTWTARVLTVVKAVLDPPKWPKADSEESNQLSKAWARGLKDINATEEDAVTAIRKLAACPPRLKRDILPAVLKLIESARPQEAKTVYDRETAAGLSAGCETCGGMGMTTVWLANPPADPHSRVTKTTAAYCECALGRWTEDNHRAREPEVFRRTPTVRDAKAGRGPWRLDPPDLAVAPPAPQQFRRATARQDANV